MKKKISWVDIPAFDLERATRFYSEILGIEFNVIDCGEEKMACFTNGEGAISTSPGFNPSRDGVIVSFSADQELGIVLDKVVKNGGEIIQPKTKIEAEGRGYFAIIIDSEGNRIGLYED